MVAFATLGELSQYAENVPGGVEIVDPGIPFGEYGTSLNEEAAYKNQPSLRKVTSFIARNVASTPLHLYERISDTDRARVRDTQIASVLASPRRKVTAFEFWRDVIMDGLLQDRYCVVFNLDPAGNLQLTRIPASRFRLIANAINEIEWVRVWDKRGIAHDLDPVYCIYSTGYSPKGVNGLSPIDTLRSILAESSEAVAYRRSVWQNAARIPQVIERPKDAGDWTDAGFKRFQSQWAAFKRGGGNEGGTPVLEDGMTVKEVTSFRPKDTLDLEGRKLTDAEIASAYFIAPELVGARDGTYSNVEAFRQMLYRDSLGPWITAWEQSLNVHLVPEHGDRPGLYIEANIEAKLRGSFEEQARVLQASTGGPWLTRNEARARANLPAIDGADELIVPLNVIEGGQASPQDSAPEGT